LHRKKKWSMMYNRRNNILEIKEKRPGGEI